MSVPVLAGVTLLQTTFGEFAYPNVKQIVPLLSDGNQLTGNAVLQSAALGFKQADLAFYLDDRADVTLLRELSDSADPAVYVDHEGETWTVSIFSFSASAAGNRIWECAATLVVIEQHYS